MIHLETPERAAARLDRALARLADLRDEINGPLPDAAAERQMDDIEDHLRTIGTKLRAALKILASDRRAA